MATLDEFYLIVPTKSTNPRMKIAIPAIFCYTHFMNNKPKIGIIGGGPAGMMAAATLIESGVNCQITIFDKNDHLGAKVIISGGGRCNLTTGLRDVKKVLKKYTRGQGFLNAAISKFTPKLCYEWFEDHGVPLKIEKDLRVFPKSNNGNDVVGVFEKILNNQSVEIKIKTNVSKVEKAGEKYLVIFNRGEMEFDYLVITSGGNAYRQTGSSGDGYAFAQDLGHSITQLGPSLNSFETKEKWVAKLSGLSFDDALLKVSKPVIKVTGPFLFTHFGISGPVTFSLSSNLSYQNISEKKPIEVSITPKANLKFNDWDTILVKDIKNSPKKNLKTILTKYFPQRFVEVLIYISKVNSKNKASELSKENRQKITHLLSGGLKVNLVKRRQEDEFVTAGGVDTDEINKQTMESKISAKLFFAGEVMNIDGLTGGFNLHAAWATGKLAGNSITKLIKQKSSNIIK